LVYWQRLGQAGGLNVDHLVITDLLVIGLLMIASLAISLYHLGSPSNAWRALANLSSSWLSREILFALLFSFFLGMFTILRLFDLGHGALRAGLVAITAMSGLALVYCMARLYMLRTVPAWNSRLTLLAFFTTTFLLGSLLIGTILTIQTIWMNFKQALEALVLLPWIAGICLLALLAEFILVPLNLRHMLELDVVANLGRPLSQIYLLRIAPLVLGVALAGITFFSAAPPINIGWVIGAGLSFTLVLVSEIFGRLLFYENRLPAM
jgi:anaerobic dimethyl sulfoxide reductase subunit C (anchor subunit)